MIAGLFVGAVLCAAAEPEAPKLTPPAAPGASEAHKDALARYGAAVWNLRRERLLTAAKQFEAAANADPEATEPLKELARLYAQLGREVEAIRLAQKALRQDPTDYDSAVLLARLLADAGELKEAVTVAKGAIDNKLLAEQPEKAVRAYRDLAALCEKANDLAAAERALTKAVELLVDKRAVVIALFAFTPKGADTEAADCLERVRRGQAVRRPQEGRRPRRRRPALVEPLRRARSQGRSRRRAQTPRTVPQATAARRRTVPALRPPAPRRQPRR